MDINTVISAVTAVTGITYEQMKQKTRKGEIVNARQWVYFFASGTLSAIGGKFNQDHATVLHARKKKRDLMETYRQIRVEHHAIKNLITKITERSEQKRKRNHIIKVRLVTKGAIRSMAQGKKNVYSCSA